MHMIHRRFSPVSTRKHHACADERAGSIVLAHTDIGGDRVAMDEMVTAGLALAGLAIGLLIGGSRPVRVYDWETEWNIDAPLADVYRVMTTPQEQYHWWPSMQVHRVISRPDNQPGGTIIYHVKQAQSVARLVPPFKITSVTDDVEPERRTRTVVSGDLIGVLETLFSARPDGGTHIRYHWYVRVRNPLLNLAGFFLGGMFRASHDHVMQEGEAGLQQYMHALVTAVPGVDAQV
jgi:uncharacterized protein YndB with AHSA1/START domain